MARLALFSEAVVMLCAYRIAVWLLPFRWLRPAVKPRLPRNRRLVPLAQLIRAVNGAARVVPCTTCLVRAMAGAHFFARHGHGSAIRIGVARTGNGLGAHAWVEAAGTVLIGGPVSQFTCLKAS